MKVCSTFEAKIYCGLKEGYDGNTHTIEEVHGVCQKYCDEIGYCVTITPTKFVYKNGQEDGAIIGLINYPRFKTTPENTTAKAIEIAKLLKQEFNQFRVSIVCSGSDDPVDNTTYMIEDGDE